jgi:SAM-dependent methyltransferase
MAVVKSPEDLVAGQLRYYGARADEYDATSLGVRTEARQAVPAVVDGLDIRGDVLELGCGTGMWTIELVRHASSLTALDGAAEMLALARDRLAGKPVEFVLADVFEWTPARRYDVVLSAFLVSHIPPEWFARFCEVVGSALRPGGRAVLIDELPSRSHFETVRDGDVATRTLSDGSRHEIVKIFYDPDDLVAQLRKLGWDATVTETDLGWFVTELAPRSVSTRD